MRGRRHLTDLSQKYLYNAWDNFAPSEEDLGYIVAKIEKDRGYSLEYKVESHPWEIFYQNHAEKFYRDRTWIRKEYPWIFGPGLRVLELGCGVGNSLSQFTHESSVMGCDFSEAAVCLARKRFPYFEFWKCDIVTDRLRRCDIAMLIFTLSAIDPSGHLSVLRNVHEAMSHGGRLVFRDFGVYDYRQVKYKPEQTAGENFYRRGDGTFTYFFTKSRLRDLAEKAGFRVLELDEWRSLTVNRKTRFEMFRVTIKAVLEK